jgi:hypothetical protein
MFSSQLPTQNIINFWVTFFGLDIRTSGCRSVSPGCGGCSASPSCGGSSISPGCCSGTSAASPSCGCCPFSGSALLCVSSSPLEIEEVLTKQCALKKFANHVIFFICSVSLSLSVKWNASSCTAALYNVTSSFLRHCLEYHPGG